MCLAVRELWNQETTGAPKLWTSGPFREHKVAFTLRLMTVETRPALLSLTDPGHGPVDDEILPIAAFRIETFLTFNHYRKHLRLCIVCLNQLLANNDRT